MMAFSRIRRFIAHNGLGLAIRTIITICAVDAGATTNFYHIDRKFVPVAYTSSATPTAYKIIIGASNLTGIVQLGTNVVFDTNASYAVEYESVALGYSTPDAAWYAVTTNYSSNTQIHSNKTYDNAGWVKGTYPAYGTWGGFLWLLQNHVTFKTSPTNFWISASGVTNLIDMVLVGTVGEYSPMTTAVDVGPTNWASITNYLGSGGATDVVCKADFTAYYKLVVPKVELTNIKFNWDTNSSSSDAINIRQDYNTAYNISNGEWVKGGANIPICYTTNKSVTIKARFTMQPTNILNADVWAISIGSGCALGDVIKTNVAFSGGVSEYITFQVSGRTTNCIRKSTSGSWLWKMGNVNGLGTPAMDFATSGVHTVYTILNEPVAPWDNTYNASNNAWVKALDFDIGNASCNGDSTASNALIHITQFLHTGHGLTYDVGTFGGDKGRQKYNISGTFNLTGYIDKSSGLWGTAGNVVNCYDQAGGVSVCARLMGIPAEYVFMGYTLYNGRPPFGYILATDLIGVGGLCNNPFYPTISPTNNIPLLGTGGNTDLIDPCRSMFSNHAFVKNNGVIYDACAGPHLGSETLAQYASSVIDITSVAERYVSPDSSTWGGDMNGAFSTSELNNALDPDDITGVK